MPKKTVETDSTTVASSQGTDHISMVSSGSSSSEFIVRASDINSSNNLGGFIGENVQSNLDSLSSEARKNRPPLMGQDPVTFQNQSGASATHDGRPDWGATKIVDTPAWMHRNRVWVENREMPHIGFGHAQDDATFTNFKWVNEGGVYDTINLNYRDNDQMSYYGLGDTQFTHVLFPQISQSVPRSSFSYVEDSLIYPFYYQESIFGSETRSDFFNATTSNTLGMSSGRGRSSFGVKEGEPSTAVAPISSQAYQPYLSKDLFDNKSNDIGLVISGTLFPADRGVLALIRFPSNSDSVSAGINTPATDYSEVLSRVVGAINLGQGVGQSDGLPGGSIFSTSEGSDFPSLRSGQHDLYELHTGNYVLGSHRTGANPNLTADPTIGQVRLLTDPLAFNVEDNQYPLGVPILFSPYEYSTSSNTKTLVDNRNFLSYRLPVLEDYSPDGMVTQTEERDRFFVKKTPNLDQENPEYRTLFSTAGGFVTFGGKDNYSYQVARYRHVVNLMDLAPDTYANITALTDNPEYNFGSFALLHFKTEAGFERLVRDGIPPSDEELYSQNLLDYSDLSENIRVDQGTVGGDGIEDGRESYASALGLSLFRPNVCFEKARFSDRPANAEINASVKTDYLYPNYNSANSSKINRDNSYFSFISGVIYISPTMPFVYEGHPDEDGVAIDLTPEESKFSKIRNEIQITGTADDNDLIRWVDSRPSKTSTVRPHTQLLSSSLTAQNNITALDSTFNDFVPTGQSVWVEGYSGSLSTEVYAKGDAVKPISDLSAIDPKDGLCTLSSSATRTSILINNPHRQWSNVGVDVVIDDVETVLGNAVTNDSKVLYHSARKISLLELHGSRLSPSGTTLGGTSISSISDVFSPYGDDGYPGGNDESFLHGYVFAWWQNTTADVSQDYNPKTSGQSFSVYRYDEEGYKVYQNLELLPIGGVIANGYALELCSGWKRVDENGNDVNTSSTFKYPQDRPVYRPTESNFERTSLRSHADAKFLMVKDVEYYIECYPSVPFTSGLGPDPSTYDETTVNQTIFTLGGSGYSDLQLIIEGEENPAQDVWAGYLGTNGLYSNLGAVNDSQCQWLGVNLDPTQAPYNVSPQADLGNTSHVRGVIYIRSSSSFSYDAAKPHPHPQPSVDYNGHINYGVSFLEVAPTGNRELPEYGNFTQDVRGYITVSGLGNEPFYTEDQIHATAPEYNSRIPLKSLFTLRKDTQERFLDESYRMESSLYHLLLTPDDPLSTTRYSNTSASNSYDPSYLFGANNFLIENLQGPGIPHAGSGINKGYICVPVRDESTISPELFTQLRDSDPADDLFRRTAGHGGAGYLRNSWHVRRSSMSSDLAESDWREAQVIGFPDMTRNLLSGSKYGTPPRGILVYPHLDFDGNSPFTLEEQTVGSNNLISSNEGYFLPNAGKGSSDTREGTDWLDDDGGNGGVSLNPKLRHAQPNYNKAALLSDFADPNEYPDVGYLRAFDVNFGKNPSLTPQHPYWNQDWNETTSTGTMYRGGGGAQNYGLIEKKQWVRVMQDSRGELEFAPVKLRLVGVDWNMISFMDTGYPLQKRDGMVHEVDGGYYLVKKRVMRVFVKVPGLTSWLDVGVFDNQVGESYRQWRGDKTDSNVGFADPNGATSLKDSTELDGAGCCISYSEKFLPEEGLVCLDLDLNLGMIPSFNSWGADENSAIGYDSNLVSDEYLGFVKNLRVDNCPSDRVYLHRQNNKSARDVGINGAKNFESPILVKVILSHPEHPKYEVHPDDNTKLVNSTDIDDLTLEIADIANATPNNVSIVDIRPSPNTSYLGHSCPPDDRSPLWSRRGLMGIEVLRQDGSNYDRDHVMGRPDYTSIDLYGNPTLYYGRTENGLVYETYEMSTSALTNKRTYTHGSNVSPSELSSDYKKPVKGEG
jgi:hypothetical protein